MNVQGRWVRLAGPCDTLLSPFDNLEIIVCIMLHFCQVWDIFCFIKSQRKRSSLENHSFLWTFIFIIGIIFSHVPYFFHALRKVFNYSCCKTDKAVQKFWANWSLWRQNKKDIGICLEYFEKTASRNDKC